MAKYLFLIILSPNHLSRVIHQDQRPLPPISFSCCTTSVVDRLTVHEKIRRYRALPSGDQVLNREFLLFFLVSMHYWGNFLMYQ